MRNRFSLLRELSLAKEDDRYMCLQTDSRAGCICLSFVINAETRSTKYSYSISWNIRCSPTDVAPVLMLAGCIRSVTSKRIHPGKQVWVTSSLPVDCCLIHGKKNPKWSRPSTAWFQLASLAIPNCWNSHLGLPDTLLGRDAEVLG